PGAVLLQAGEHRLVAVIDHRLAEPRAVAAAGVLPHLPILRLSLDHKGQRQYRGGCERFGHVAPSPLTLSAICRALWFPCGLFRFGSIDVNPNFAGKACLQFRHCVHNVNASPGTICGLSGIAGWPLSLKRSWTPPTSCAPARGTRTRTF